MLSQWHNIELTRWVLTNMTIPSMSNDQEMHALQFFNALGGTLAIRIYRCDRYEPSLLSL
jgi:hypothetical protein